MTATLDLTAATPAQIDTAWAEAIAPIYAKIDAAESRIAACDRHIEMMDERGKDTMYGLTREDIEGKRKVSVAQRIVASNELAVVEAPFDREYAARGGWTRAYKVTNTNGHIHSSTHCNTCFSTTQFAWITELSGHTTDEIADLAGEMACTVCYPNAPVSKPCQIFTPAEKATQAERDAKAVAREAKAAKAAANAIVEHDDHAMPNGNPLREDAGKGYTIKTVASAKQALNRAAFSLLSMANYIERGGDEDQIAHWTHLKAEYEAEVWYLAHNIACHYGMAEGTSDEFAMKARTKAGKDWAASVKRAKAMGLPTF